MNNEGDYTVPIIGIDRLRINSDGVGVTTLVCFWGCPLSCQYCLNPQSWRTKTGIRNITPLQLFQEVSIDKLYFFATGGGVTFGGGEPLLYPRFLKEFHEFVEGEWKINLETSLNVPIESLQLIADCIDCFYIDIKDTNNEIYTRYTGKKNERVFANLAWLVEHIGEEKIVVRVPLIPDFNTISNVNDSIKFLKDKYKKITIDQFEYRKG
ncbi:MAG: radical SAM protein [Paludibacteraceae bacterium]|jgi:pyruvate formate lyase activating enzyme|nr:radical SAM protein [Paludibacteraceae bacterium]